MRPMDRFLPNILPDFEFNAEEPRVQNDVLNNHRVRSSAQQLLQLLQSEVRDGRALESGDVSVYTGISGYSLLYYFLFKRTGEQHFLNKSQKYAELALKQRQNRCVTFVCGDAGPLVMSALASSAAGDQSAAGESIDRLLGLVPLVVHSDSQLPDELLYGRTGFLFALNFLRQEIPSARGKITDDVIRQVLTAIIESGVRTASSSASPAPLFFYWHDSAYIGAAHGFCGIVYHLLLNDRLLRKQELESLIKPTLDFVLSQRFPSGNIRSSCGKESDRLVHWCHGAPGFVYVLIEGYRVFGDQKYMDAAIACGDVIWNRGLLKKGYGLCHGIAGNAYAFLCLFRATGQRKHLHRAVKFAEFCCEYGSHGFQIPDSPFSLFEGLAGTVYFLFDIERPSESAFPAYELRPI